MLERLRLGNRAFQAGLQVAGIGLSPFGYFLQEAAIDVIHINPCDRINVGDLKWIHFVMINRKDSLLVIFNGFKGVFRDDNHQVRLAVEAARAASNPFATKVWRQFNCEL